MDTRSFCIVCPNTLDAEIAEKEYIEILCGTDCRNPHHAVRHSVECVS